ncbi:hypothetical protein ACS0TY_023740 [Phlomoides rotata]
MEFYNTNEEDGILEDLLGLREMEIFDFSSTINGWNTSVDYNDLSFEDPMDLQSLHYTPFGDELSPPHLTTHLNPENQTLPYNDYQYHYSEQLFGIGAPPVPELQVKKKVKKLNGQPSKNLMAERRRRKRLNDRLSMLRSIVPKISKMDRTSILGDAIDYMKELLDRINNLQQDQMNLRSNDHQFSTFNPNEISLTNAPKFEVERRNEDTRMEIRCVGKPGLLLSTVTTLEALGLDIQHCVLTSFNDFALQASCSEVVISLFFSFFTFKQINLFHNTICET